MSLERVVKAMVTDASGEAAPAAPIWRYRAAI